MDLIVIGGGPAGYEAAAHAARHGLKTILVEKDLIGGTCLNSGCIPTKTLLKSAKLMCEFTEAGLYGIRTGGAAIDLTQLQTRKTRIVESLRKAVEGMLTKAGVEIVRGTASVVSARKVTVGDRVLEADNILVASGSAPVLPPIPGIESGPVVDSAGILATTTAPKSLAIIGGGVIGLEFAFFFSSIGTKVAVIEMMDQIAPGFDPDITTRLAALLKKKGVAIHLSSRVSEIKKDSLEFQDSAGQKQSITSDLILAAAGRRPATQGLGLERMGIAMEKGAIQADSAGRTSVKGIWACGDATGRSMLAHSATREGIVAVENILGRPATMNYDAIPSVIYTHPEVAAVGKTEPQLQAAGLGYKKALVPMAFAGRYTIENEGHPGVVKVLLDEQTGRLLGVHMLGTPCSEIIFGAALAMQRQLTAAQASEMIFPHPTISEALKEALQRI